MRAETARLRLVAVEVASCVAESRSVVASPRAVGRFVKRWIGDKDREHFVILHVSARNQVLSAETVSVGTLSGTLVHPREVFKSAILSNANGIIAAHNHPSGNPAPSPEDFEVHGRLEQAGKLLGIPLVDFLIVTRSRFWSWRESGLATETATQTADEVCERERGLPADRQVRFPLGRILITPGALDTIPKDEVLAALRRHAAGDWGELEPEDKRANDRALRDGSRILSAYRSAGNVKFWVITEADRSATTVLLPEEY